MSAGSAVVRAAQHSGQLRLAGSARYLPDGGRADRVPGPGVDDIVPIGERCDLREVGDHDDLVICSQHGQSTTDLGRRPPTYSRINLVEDERRNGIGTGKHHFHGQHDS